MNWQAVISLALALAVALIYRAVVGGVRKEDWKSRPSGMRRIA